MLVSEPMGTLLLNERMIESYLHARDRFLKPGGKMFPCLGRIHAGEGRRGARGLGREGGEGGGGGRGLRWVGRVGGYGVTYGSGRVQVTRVGLPKLVLPTPSPQPLSTPTPAVLLFLATPSLLNSSWLYPPPGGGGGGGAGGGAGGRAEPHTNKHHPPPHTPTHSTNLSPTPIL